jgi:hypothetical protein
MRFERDLPRPGKCWRASDSRDSLGHLEMVGEPLDQDGPGTSGGDDNA